MDSTWRNIPKKFLTNKKVLIAKFDIASKLCSGLQMRRINASEYLTADIESELST